MNAKRVLEQVSAALREWEEQGAEAEAVCHKIADILEAAEVS